MAWCWRGAFHRARLPAGQRRADAVGIPPGRWQLSSDKVSVDSACLSKLPGGDANSAPLALDQLQQQLPPLDLTINDLTLVPWQRYAGKLQLSSGPDGQRLHYQGPNLSAEAQLDENSS